MCMHCEHTERMVLQLKEDIKAIKKIMFHNAGALIQPKWVGLEEARIITGMGKTWLLERQVRSGGPFNEKGIFRTRLADKKIEFYKKDLEAYEKYLAGEAPMPEPIQLKKLYAA